MAAISSSAYITAFAVVAENMDQEIIALTFVYRVQKLAYHHRVDTCGDILCPHSPEAAVWNVQWI